VTLVKTTQIRSANFVLTFAVEVHGREVRKLPEIEAVDRALLAQELLEHGLLQLHTKGGGSAGVYPEEGGQKGSRPHECRLRRRRSLVLSADMRT
jgi:hypothetical protein